MEGQRDGGVRRTPTLGMNSDNTTQVTEGRKGSEANQGVTGRLDRMTGSSSRGHESCRFPPASAGRVRQRVATFPRGLDERGGAGLVLTYQRPTPRSRGYAGQKTRRDRHQRDIGSDGGVTKSRDATRHQEKKGRWRGRRSMRRHNTHSSAFLSMFYQ